MKRVITFGTYDLLHVGHLNLLMRARGLGDHLAVGVSTDALNFAKKGKYPIFPQEERLHMVGALQCVDEVFFEESLERKAEYILARSANTLVMGSDWAGAFDDLADICDVVYLPRTELVSTTQVVEFIKTRVPHEPRWLRVADL